MQLTKTSVFYNRVKRKILARVWIARLLLLVSFLGLVFIGFRLFYHPGFPFDPVSAIVSARPLRFTGTRTNFVLLGIRGETADAPDLTDTIMFVSVDHKSGDVALVTLPRDLWLSSLRAKINSAFHIGLEKSGSAGGLVLAKSAVAEVTGQPVHYAVVVNFEIFRKVIDMVGGIDIQVPRAFEDYRYPVAGRENDLCNGDPKTLCRYEHVRFEAGLTHMDGTTALKYIRSRNSENLSEGTDFARSQRQSAVVAAVREKLLSKQNALNFKLYRNLYDTVISSAVTDLTSSDFVALGRLIWKVHGKSPRTAFLTEPDHLYNPPLTEEFGYQWVLLPKNNNPTVITGFIAGFLSTDSSDHLKE